MGWCGVARLACRSMSPGPSRCKRKRKRKPAHKGTAGGRVAGIQKLNQGQGWSLACLALLLRNTVLEVAAPVAGAKAARGRGLLVRLLGPAPLLCLAHRCARRGESMPRRRC